VSKTSNDADSNVPIALCAKVVAIIWWMRVVGMRRASEFEAVQMKSGLQVRNKTTGETVLVRGYGSMKGKLALRADIDLLKPIAEQVFEGKARSRRKSKVAPAA
jgi:hypothetical protein